VWFLTTTSALHQTIALLLRLCLGSLRRRSKPPTHTIDNNRSMARELCQLDFFLRILPPHGGRSEFLLLPRYQSSYNSFVESFHVPRCIGHPASWDSFSTPHIRYEAWKTTRIRVSRVVNHDLLRSAAISRIVGQISCRSLRDQQPDRDVNMNTHSVRKLCLEIRWPKIFCPRICFMNTYPKRWRVSREDA